MKKIMVQFNIPGMTLKQVDQAWDALRASGYAHPKGLVHHTNAAHGNNILIVDVWESQQDWDNFGPVLGPILGKLGVADTQPLIVPVHSDYLGK
jgi:hypothetical protein